MPGVKNVKDMIATTNKEYYIVMDKLKRVVASGNFHHEFIPKHQQTAGGANENKIQVIDGITSCCKINLKGMEAPLVIQVSYLSKPNANGQGGGADMKVYISQKYTEPSST